MYAERVYHPADPHSILTRMKAFVVQIFICTIFVLWCCSIGPCNGLSLTNITELDRADPFSRGDFCGKGFRCLNRRVLRQCSEENRYTEISLSTQGPLGDEQNVTVTISGMLNPKDDDWVALITPSHANISNCPLNSLLYLETGDVKSLPLLCHYPVKSQFLKNDPSYKSCKNSKCEKKVLGVCVEKTCSASLTFHIVNIRTDIEFALLRDGYRNPCLIQRSNPLKFSNPNTPLSAHLNSIDSTGTSIQVTWISGTNSTQFVQYGSGKSSKSKVTTFTQSDMCGDIIVRSAAMDFGWHDPGFIHTALMTELLPSHSYNYRYGSDDVGWSSSVQFSTPPAAGASELRFLAFGDMGKAPRDKSDEHYIQPGSLSVIEAMTEESEVDSVFHIGDISYATGFLVEWDYFLHMITPLASRLSYMTAIGNHERDFPGSISVYQTPDSGGECGVAYERYFPMPTEAEDKPWYSISQGPVHFTVISTEHNWSVGSEQYKWIKQDLASVDRKQTPWLIFTGHRPMYSSAPDSLIIKSVDPDFVRAIEPFLLEYQVDLVMWGHVHNYERTCAVFQSGCRDLPKKNVESIETYQRKNNSAPVHVIIGMAGFSLDNFRPNPDNWSLMRISEFGYARIHANTSELLFEFIGSQSRAVLDRFKLT